jgi:DNA-binding XRE family transcriptional regulator
MTRKHVNRRNTTVEQNSTSGEPDHRISRLECIGTFCKNLRINDNLSQFDFARMNGLSRSTLQKAEYGGNMTLRTLFKIVDAHHLTLEEFFTEME